MPKVRASKKGIGKGNARNVRGRSSLPKAIVSSSKDEAPAQSAVNTSPIRQSRQTASINNYQALVMPAMVAPGCFGLTIYYALFTTDPNRFVFGGMALLMAITWSLIFWLRLRKMLPRK